LLAVVGPAAFSALKGGDGTILELAFAVLLLVLLFFFGNFELSAVILQYAGYTQTTPARWNEVIVQYVDEGGKPLGRDIVRPDIDAPGRLVCWPPSRLSRGDGRENLHLNQRRPTYVEGIAGLVPTDIIARPAGSGRRVSDFLPIIDDGARPTL
jgi:hypothetical protein